MVVAAEHDQVLELVAATLAPWGDVVDMQAPADGALRVLALQPDGLLQLGRLVRRETGRPLLLLLIGLPGLVDLTVA